ncbi:MAG: preprotein translocase subunit SecA [Anaerolineae bacterium]|nr:preprotein translocase subunit SecA [Anaerolineae bacterium]
MLKTIAKAVFGDPNERELNRHREVVEQINALEPAMQALSEAQFREKTDEFKARLEQGATLDDILPEAFALVREAAVRTIGQRHFDVQLIGGIVLHQGKIAEMKTGEGKTLSATLPLYLNGLLGKGAHLVTPNDYLSKFGLQQMGPIYHLLGLTSAVIQNRGGNENMHSFRFNPDWPSEDARFQNLEPIDRRDAYHADITYGTNNEFGFDYLRDNMVHDLNRLSQRGHYYAIVDEVDNILIDEARTPLIISGQADLPSDLYTLFARLVKVLEPSSQDSIDAEAPDGDYVEELKHKSTYLTERGVEKIERALAREGMLQGDNLYRPENSDMIPYLDNALRAHVNYHLDKEYVLMNGQVIIVDEFTGRMMHGRRFSEGLHQAIEAKEGVEVRRENLTLATVTFQNYFRMYEKLAGMTGTAYTEANEFEEIYNLEVTVIPTNLPIIRDDKQDWVYMNEKAKWRAVVKDIKERQERGQPVLVGTAAIETSEHLAKLLDKAKVHHEVLNAKQHEREAVIIAQAGRPGAVTIATNMAGRGVDILLGGNPDGLAREKLRRRYDSDVTEATPEQWAEVLTEAKTECKVHRQKVLAEGGLYVLGTERHEARRIDNQLRGRAGRQGDPGETRFYLSLEDDLMRRFGGDRVKNFMKWADMPEDMPIEHGMISKSIQQAQIRVEGHHFDIRKRVLEYDDVVNKQRETIYNQRRMVLSAQNGELRDQLQHMITEQIQAICKLHLAGDAVDWDLEELHRAALLIYPVPEDINPATMGQLGDSDEIELLLVKGALRVYTERIERFTPAWMAMAEKSVMLNVVDQLWQRHLTDLDILREGIGLTAYGGRDPLVEYQRQSYEMWNALQEEIKGKVVQDIYRVAPREQQPPTRRAPALILQRSLSNIQAGRGAEAAASMPVPQAQDGRVETAGGRNAPPQPIENVGLFDNVGRNDPCPCGSGKKFKHCHYEEIRNQRQTIPQSKVKQRGSTRRRR